MKRIIISIFILFLTVNSSFAQVEKETYKAVAEKLEYSYNKSEYDSIFNMFSDEMKRFLPIDKTKAYFTGIKARSGQINGRKFIKYENGSWAVYQTNLERTLDTLKFSLDNNLKINGIIFKPSGTQMRNKTKLILPFKDSWNVVWGGDTEALNYHVKNEAQKNAFDILILDKAGKSYKTDGKTNEDYYAFGRELIAPCDGEVVLVVHGVKDNIPGQMNSYIIPGNTVILKTLNNEFLVFCHFKHQSIKVKEGERVKQGQTLGLCGNSGQSSESHLHFHIQNVENMSNAIGIKCYFDKIMVNGQLKNDYSPIQNEIIGNDEK